MNEKTFQKKLAELVSEIGALPEPERTKLESLAQETQERHQKLRTDREQPAARALIFCVSPSSTFFLTLRLPGEKTSSFVSWLKGDNNSSGS